MVLCREATDALDSPQTKRTEIKSWRLRALVEIYDLLSLALYPLRIVIGC